MHLARIRVLRGAQRIVYEVIKGGFLDQHVPTIRACYKAQRDAMAAALEQHLPDGSEWSAPHGGMFFWVRLPEGCHAMALLEQAVAAGVAYVPGEAFYAHAPDPRTMRLSFVTLSADDIRVAVAALGRVPKRHLEGLPPLHAPAGQSPRARGGGVLHRARVRIRGGCQREPKCPQLGELKIPHPRVHSVASAGRTRPALSLSLSR